MRDFGIAASGLGIPATLFANSSLKSFAAFEGQLNKNTALIDGTKIDFNELKKLAEDLSKTTIFDAGTIAAGEEALAASGWSLTEIKDGMGTVAQMAQATGEPLTQMSDILVNVLSEFGAGSDQAGEFGDILAKAANESTADISDMGESLKYVGNMAGVVGKDVYEISSALAVMANHGIKGTMSGTGLVEIFRSLSKLTPKSKDALEGYGLTPEDIDPSTHSMEELLETFNKAKLSTEDLFKIFGSEAAPKISALISDQGLKEYQDMLKKITEDSKGALQTFSDSQVDSLTMAMHQIDSIIEEVKNTVGEGLKPLIQDIATWLKENADTIKTFASEAVEAVGPVIKNLLDIIKDAMNWFNSLPDDMQSKVAGFAGIGTAVSAIAGPLLLFASVPVSGLSKITGFLSGLFSVTKGAGVGSSSKDVGALADALKRLAGATGNYTIATDIGKIGTSALTAEGSVATLSGTLGSLVLPVAFGTLFAIEADKVMDAVGRMTVETMKKNEIDLHVKTIADKPDNPSWIEWYQAPLEKKIDMIPVIGDAFDLGSEFGKWIGDQRNITNSTKTTFDTMWRRFQDSSATAVKAAGNEVEVFANGDIARLNNRLQESQNKVKNLGMTTTDTFDTIKDSLSFKDQGWLDNLNYQIEQFSQQTGQSVEEVRQRIINQDFTPVQFEDGTLYYSYQNGVLAPIQDDPLMIGVDTGYVSAGFEEVRQKYLELKSFVENNKIDADIDVAQGNKNQTELPDTIKKAYSPDTRNTSGWEFKGIIKDETEAGTKAGMESTLSEYQQWLQARGKGTDAYSQARYKALYEKETGISAKGTTSDPVVVTGIDTEDSGTEPAAYSKDWMAGIRDTETALTTIAKLPVNQQIQALEDWGSRLDGTIPAVQTYTNTIESAGPVTETATENTEALSKETKTTADNIFQFSEPVKIAGESTTNLAGGADTATSALQTFSDELGTIDLKSMILDWLGEGDLSEALGRKTSDMSAMYGHDVSSLVESGISGTLAKDIPKLVSWEMEKGTPLDEVIQKGSQLWYDYADEVLKSTYAGYNAPSGRGWERENYIDDRLTADTRAIIDGLFENAIPLVKGIYSGEYTAQAGTDYLGNQNMKNSSKYWSNDWSLAGKAVENSGQEAKTATPVMDQLNTIFTQMGMSGSNASTMIGNLNSALSDNVASMKEAQGYLSQYNQATGQNTKYTSEQESTTQKLMNALSGLNTAQGSYQSAMSDGILTAKEASGINSQLANVNKLLGDAGITAQTGISGLPQILQGLGAAAQSAMQQIQAAISAAQSAAQTAATEARTVGTVTDRRKQSYQISINNNSATSIDANYNLGQIIDGVRRIGA